MNPIPEPDDRLTSTPAERDFVEVLLTPKAVGQDSALRQRLLEQTTRSLRGRQWRRRMAWASALVGCYVAGILTMRLWPSPPGPQTNETKPKDETRPAILAAPTPAEREWNALESDDQQAEKYRAAGDAYLTESADPLAALRCYTAALDRGGKESLDVRPEDSWLLMQIKIARSKEMNVANNPQ